MSDTVTPPFRVTCDHDLMRYSREYCHLGSLHISFMDAQALPLMLNICLVCIVRMFIVMYAYCLEHHWVVLAVNKL